MKMRDWGWIATLLGLGSLIWLRDLAWTRAAADTLPVLIALPLFAWLGVPWQFAGAPEKIPLVHLAAACVLLAGGALADITFILASGWTMLLASWLRTRLVLADRARMYRLLPLALLAFPWIAQDCQPLAWWFRLSAAGSAQVLFSSIGLTVAREGTNLLVQSSLIAVEPACAGLDTLQAMLIAGCAPAFFCFPRGGPKYWTCLLSLLAVSWFANTVRVITIAAAALALGSEFAMGAFHNLGGCLVLAVMFALCCAAFSLVRRFTALEAPSA